MGLSLTETLEITFDGDTVEEIVATFEFEDEDAARGWYEFMVMVLDEDISRSGTTITMTASLEEFDFDEDTTREEVEEFLEEEGYTIR